MQNNDPQEQKRRCAIVCEDFNGILPYNEFFYLHSILYSAEQCLRAFARYDHLLNKEGVKPESLVNAVQDAIGHAAALSRYFWPSPQVKKDEKHIKQLREKRGAKLRNIFALDEQSPIYNRDIRNAWEHFDERLDVYLLDNEGGYYFPGCMLNSYTIADEPGGHIFKLLDVPNECLVLMGEKYFFGPIWDEVSRIYEHCLECDKAGRLLYFDPKEMGQP